MGGRSEWPPGRTRTLKTTKKVDEITALESIITHLVKLYCADNPGARAAWDSAAHVEKAPTKKTPPTP